VTDVTVVFREPTIILPYALVGGTVSGHVVDEAGDPVEGVTVQLWRTAFQGGLRTLTAYGLPRATDDRGQYRLFHIPAGRYLLSATDESWRATGEWPWLPVYYPGQGAPLADDRLQIGSRQELANITMILRRSYGSRVFGSVVDSSGRPLRARVDLFPTGRFGAVTLQPWSVVASEDGAFEFSNVPPGDYAARVGGQTAVLVSAPAAAAPAMEFGLQPVAVNGPVIGPLAIRTAATVTLRGRGVFQRTNPGTAVGGVTAAVSAVAADPLFADIAGRQSIATINQGDGTFELRGLAGAVRLVLTSAPEGWWMRSARVGGIDASRETVVFTGDGDSRDDVTIVLADTAATIAGSVVDTLGQPAPDGWVVVFGTDREQWFPGSSQVRAVYSGDDGLFSVGSLPPGSYFVAAVDKLEGDTTFGEWQYPDVLDSLAALARRVTVGESQRLTIAQRLVVSAR
jgi:hypothetical protein